MADDNLMKLSSSNLLCLGDCVETMSRLPPGIGDLIYIDPPFFSNRVYFANAGRTNQRNVFVDKWTNGIDGYCKWLESLLYQCRRIIKDTGSIYLQCDQHASHYSKVLLDRVFGYKNFRNEIIWRRKNAHSDWSQGSRHFGRIHDTLFFYTASDEYTWNQLFIPYDSKYLESAYRHKEEGTQRLFAYTDLSGPGGASKGNPRYSFLGVTRNWRYSEAKMNDLLRAGRIVQTSPTSVPIQKRYLDEMKGKQLQDIWDDILPINNGSEKVGYPTQKPERLLERVILASSNESDLLIDPLFGSGTSLLAASKLRRQWIGIDSSVYANSLTRKRLKKLGYEFSTARNTDEVSAFFENPLKVELKT